jgi:hypothetical protein
MTLVVAKKKGDVLSLVSDTGISLNGKQLGPDKQLPKLCILKRDLAVGFSGSPELAVRIMEGTPTGYNASYRTLTQHFLEGHRQHDCDFILAFGAPLSKLALISDGIIRQGRTTEWIGDKVAFEAFQGFRLNREPPLPYIDIKLGTNREIEAKGKLPSFDMIGSMRTIIERADVPSVFGHPVGINNALGSFEFLNYTVTLEEKASFKLPRGVNPAQVMSRIAEAQNYAFSCFVSSPADPNQAVAFHYMRGKVTYIYWGKSGEPLTNFVLHRDLNAIELGEWALTELAVKWIGSITSRAGIPANYGIPTNQWQRWSGWSSPR